MEQRNLVFPLKLRISLGIFVSKIGKQKNNARCFYDKVNDIYNASMPSKQDDMNAARMKSNLLFEKLLYQLFEHDAILLCSRLHSNIKRRGGG